MSDMNEFSDEQKKYLEGFASGIGIARLGALGTIAGKGAAGPGAATASGPDAIHHQARARTVAAGGKLVAEEKAKGDKHPFEMWDEMRANAEAGRFPKRHRCFSLQISRPVSRRTRAGQFHVRLRIPGGMLRADQLAGLADLAEKYAGPYAHVTTRANLQLREIGPAATIHILTGCRNWAHQPRRGLGQYPQRHRLTHCWY